MYCMVDLKSRDPKANFVQQNYSSQWKVLSESEKGQYNARAKEMFPIAPLEAITDRAMKQKKSDFLRRYKKMLTDMHQHGFEIMSYVYDVASNSGDWHCEGL